MDVACRTSTVFSAAIVVMEPAVRRTPWVVVGVEPRGQRDPVAVDVWAPSKPTWSVAPIPGSVEWMWSVAMRGGQTKGHCPRLLGVQGRDDVG